MASKRQYRHEDISTPPKGWKVRTKTLPSGHLVRIAFPPGRRRKGSGEVVSILHPLGKNPCQNPCNPLSSLDTMLDDFKAYLKAGYNKFAAETEVLKHSIAGGDTLAKFRETVKNPTEEEQSIIAEYSKKGKHAISGKGGGFFIEGRGYVPLKTARKETGINMSKPRVKRGRVLPWGDYATVAAMSGRLKGNPTRNLDHIDQAAELHEAFVGEPAKEVVVVNEHEKVRDDYAQLGWTDQLVFHPPYDHQEVKLKEISELYSSAIDDNENPTRAWQDIADELGIPLLVFDTQGDEIRLTASADGKQLYFIGGRQAAFEKHLKDFKTDRNKDLVDLGDLVSLTYSAKKVQAGDTASHPYYHIFGEEGGTAPRASYDTINKRFRISGGSYSLREADRGIVN
jgi:hypothetical protein